jgi:hypothetical protein
MNVIEKLRGEFHQKLLLKDVLSVDDNNVASNADTGNRTSKALALGVMEYIVINLANNGFSLLPAAPAIKLVGQTAGNLFETCTAEFIKAAMTALFHLKPGQYKFIMGGSIDNFAQYKHLKNVSEALRKNRVLRAALGDYIISPDITVAKLPISDKDINQHQLVIDDSDFAELTPVRAANSSFPLLHASISCKWTLRSDRAQNARTEGLNLVRGRCGHTPHIIVVTGEPLLSRISSLALGTGDIDCVYHFALNELVLAVKKYDNDDVTEQLRTLIEGNRLRDISDLPFDLMA